MSKQRQRARAEMEARQREARRAKTAEKKARGPRDPSPKAAPPRDRRRGKQTVYRQRRFPPLPLWLKLALALFWIAVQVVVWLTIESIGTRIALGIISLFALPLIVVLVRDPSRRTKR